MDATSTDSDSRNMHAWRNSFADACGLNADGTKLRPIVVAMLHTMSVRADNDTRRFFITHDEIAERMGIQLRAVTKLIAEAIESGWIVRTKVGHNGRSSRYVLTFGRSNNPSGATPNHFPTEVGSTAVQVVGGTAVQVEVAQPDTRTTKGTTPGTTNSSADAARSTQASPAASGETKDAPKKKPTSIRSDWQPNKTHHKHYAPALDLPIIVFAYCFKRWAVGEGVRRSDWSKTFSAFLKCFVEEVHPELRGFDGFDKYQTYPPELNE